MSDFPSAYSISFDHAPSNSFNGNQDSFTSFGSPQTPPRLRAMLRSLFDGTVPNSLNTGSSPSLSGPNPPSESFSRYVPASMIADHLNHGPMLADSFNDPESLSLESEHSSSVGDVYWYNAPSSTVSSDGPGFLTLQIDPRLFGSFNEFGSFNDCAQLSASSNRSPDPADIDQLDDASSLVASNQEPVLSSSFDHISSGNEDEAAVEMSSSVANDRLDGTRSIMTPLSSVPEDASDFSYVPPRRFRSARHQRSARSSGLNRVKPSPVCHRMRDARGRFISSRTKKPAEIAETRFLSLLGSAQGPPCLPDPDAVRRIEMETATNTFLNTVLCSKEEPYCFNFDTPNPFHSEFNAAPLFAAAPPSPKSLPGDLNSPFLPDPQVKFRESYLGLYKAILPFISDLSFHCNKEKVYELSKILYATQERFNESSYLYPNVAQAGIPTTSDHVWMG
ncbi:hypothetical protein Pst134EB_001348 [Puccinia striiformis f. sp. tritici]|nr:hypothetical protein Pst134EB_001342 [Puccinia striiformis f. sp. tritici]KAH9466289.1 hypothetical protein Pst134EB_001344 [Puccinia striiformis f. sp. tritici]KAH9466293.1 hypothetical protein Pst134EB_001348 [Puccinia striiformis f. sp. tritici]